MYRCKIIKTFIKRRDEKQKIQGKKKAHLRNNQGKTNKSEIQGLKKEPLDKYTPKTNLS